MNIIEAIKDPKLFRPFLADKHGSIDSWQNWMVFHRVLFGLPIKSERSRQLVKLCTGRDWSKLPKGGFQTAMCLAGRRSGKSRQSSILGAHAAVLAGLEKKLAKGERGVIPIISPSKAQGRIIREYLRAACESPLLKNEIEDEQRDGFSFRNGNRVEILAGDFRSVRGYTMPAAIVDEIAFFGLSEESRVRSDTELIRAIQPALATTQGTLVCIGSPYARKGWCWTTYNKHWGNDKSNVLVWNCPSRTMNPTLSQKVVDAALEEDRAAALSEYMGEFRDDVGIFLSREVIEGLVEFGRHQLLPRSSHKYVAFADVSGGRTDGSALAIGHREGRKIILDFCKLWRSPCNPHLVIAEMADELHKFGIRKVVGDNYAAEFVATSFKSNEIKYERAEKPKSVLYSELLPIICAGEIELLDNETLINQLAGLERRTRSGGRDIIDHSPGGADDLANSLAGMAVYSHARRCRVGAGGF